MRNETDSAECGYCSHVAASKPATDTFIQRHVSCCLVMIHDGLIMNDGGEGNGRNRLWTA
jgi:hypothetical protein